MCISIIFAADLGNEYTEEFARTTAELGRKYNYGIGMGPDGLLASVRKDILGVMENPPVIFEVHDHQEEHCACDIDEDIRVAAKLGRQSQFFDFCREILNSPGLHSLSVLIFQEVLPSESGVRRYFGTWTEFTALLNKWHTWQVEGFEPNRAAYYIADSSPLLYKFTLPA